jgi:hypothetical protein
VKFTIEDGCGVKALTRVVMMSKAVVMSGGLSAGWWRGRRWRLEDISVLGHHQHRDEINYCQRQELRLLCLLLEWIEGKYVHVSFILSLLKKLVQKMVLAQVREVNIFLLD